MGSQSDHADYGPHVPLKDAYIEYVHIFFILHFFWGVGGLDGLREAVVPRKGSGRVRPFQCGSPVEIIHANLYILMFFSDVA